MFSGLFNTSWTSRSWLPEVAVKNTSKFTTNKLWDISCHGWLRVCPFQLSQIWICIGILVIAIPARQSEASIEIEYSTI
jgi:hypothetical protein